MRYTLKEMVDIILSAMDSDEVNSYSDTVESNQVALLIKSVYYDIATDLNLPEHKTLLELTASGDNTKPVHFTLPTNVTEVLGVRYDIRESGDTYPDYQEIQYVSFFEFLDRQQGHREDTTGISSFDFVPQGDSNATHTIIYLTDRHPTFYTQADDFTLIFNAHDSTLDTTLQKSKTLVEGMTYPTFTLSDTFEPELDPTQFAYFLNRCKVRAFAELKQQAHDEAAQEARRQRIIVQDRKRRTPDLDEIEKVKARYGRK